MSTSCLKTGFAKEEERPINKMCTFDKCNTICPCEMDNPFRPRFHRCTDCFWTNAQQSKFLKKKKKDWVNRKLFLTLVYGMLTRAKHAADVGVSFVESLLNDGVDEGRSVEQHPLVALIVVLFGNFPPAVRVALPQLDVPDFGDFQDFVSRKHPASVALVTVLPDCGLHLLFDGRKLGVVSVDVDQNSRLAASAWRWLPNHGSCAKSWLN